MNQIAEHIGLLKERIADAATAANRNPDEIHLVAVSKKQPCERIEAALECGHRLFGENRVQEAQEHWLERRKKFPDMKLHLIGPLQTNKAADAVALFDCIETLDRQKLVDALCAEMKKQNKSVPCFIQVNTGGEEQKSGVAPQDLKILLDYSREKKLEVMGLMCIPPLEEPPELHFAFLKKLADIYGLKNLSMGMSGDFEKSIPIGATHIRIGSALFGERI